MPSVVARIEMEIEHARATAGMPDPVNKRDKRLPFSREQLHAIFNAPLYRGCSDGERG